MSGPGNCSSLSIQELPVELLYPVSLGLSVKDLCHVRATNKSLRNAFSNEYIWRHVIRDILTVKPLLRLSYAYQTMTSEALMSTAVRLAAQDTLMLQDRKRPLKLWASFEVNSWKWGNNFHQCPVLLPGGSHFVLPNSSLTQLRVLKTDGSPKIICLLVPKSCQPICCWKAIPASAEELLIATVTQIMGNDKRWKSTIIVRRRNLFSGSYKKISTFVVRQRVDALDLRGTLVALSWRQDSRVELASAGRFFFVRDYEQDTETGPVYIELPTRDWCLDHVTISLLSARRLVVASHLAQYMISIPNYKTSHCKVTGNPVKVAYHSSSAREGGHVGKFHLPFFLPLSWEEGLPDEIAIWSGNPLHVISSHDQRQPPRFSPSEKPSAFQLMNTGMGAALGWQDCAVGTTIGLANMIKSGMTLVVTPPSASDRGLARFGREYSAPVLNGTFEWRLGEGERVKRCSIDEESSRLLVLKCHSLPEGSLKWHISLYDLH